MNFGIIADGNRRWARKNGRKIADGHRAGFRAIRDEILPALENSAFSAATIYAFSTENWGRSIFEVRNLMKIFHEFIDEFLPRAQQKNYQFFWAGRRNRVPQILKKKLENAEKILAKNSGLKIFLCLDYGGRDEILRTFSKIFAEKKIQKISKISEKFFSENLEIPNLDAVFRSGGERRISNFCIWQSAYSEFFFTEKFLPEIKKFDIEKILENFANRERRRGGN